MSIQLGMRWLSTSQALIAGAIFATCALVKPLTVAGDSMEPFLKSGERLVTTNAYWLFGDIQCGDVVVFRDPEGTDEILIKRVFAFEGEIVPPKLTPSKGIGSEMRHPYRVPEDSIYVLGDNARESVDSRSFGAVPRTEILGRVVGISYQRLFNAFSIVTGWMLTLLLAMLIALHAKHYWLIRARSAVAQPR